MTGIRFRFVIQRAHQARILANGQDRGGFDHGLIVYAGIGKDPNPESDAEVSLESLKPSLQLAVHKILNLRTFGAEDVYGALEVALAQVHGAIGLVSQFTLWADCRKGHRPGFQQALEPTQARRVFEALEAALRQEAALLGVPVISGIFGATMEIAMTNMGPITYVLDIVDGRVLEP